MKGAITTIRLLYRALMELYSDSREDKSFTSTNFNSINWGFIVVITGLGFVLFVLVGKLLFLLNLIISIKGSVDG